MTMDNSNAGFPKYEFTIGSEDEDNLQATQTSSAEALKKALEMINVVPNPYYGYSQYEDGRIDTRIKVVNLPERANVNIYNTRGKLIRSFQKDDALTSLDWDLKNSKGIPIAGGVYLIHVKISGLEEEGERVLKWFGGLREPDLENL
jgi:flagellar hook assembly protein FlgD